MKYFLITILAFFVSIHKVVAQENPLSNNFYQRLGLSSTASQEEIKNAYRKLAMKYHPDRNLDRDSRTHFQNIKEAFEVLTGKNKLPTQSHNQQSYQSRSSGSKESYADEKEVFNKLYDYYNQNKNDKNEELKILTEAFSMGKYQIEDLMGDKQVNKIMEKIFSSQLWNDNSNGLLETFVTGWGLYTFKTSSNLLTLLFSQLEPNNFYLKSILYDYNFPSPGRDFSSQAGRKNWLLIVGAKLLRTDKYRGTKYAEQLLAHNYEMWQFMKSHSNELSPYPLNLWVLEILSLLDQPEYQGNEKVIKMAREIPKLLEAGVIGIGGVFTDKAAITLYRNIIKTHRDVFEGVIINSPIDDLIWLYKDLSEKERSQHKEAEIKILKRVLSLDKYAFEAIMKDGEFGFVWEKLSSSKIWADESNGLFKLYVNSWAFYSLRFSSKTHATLFGQMESESHLLNRVLYNLDFGLNLPNNYSQTTDFGTHEKRLLTIKPILSYLLLQSSYENTKAGTKLINSIQSLWLYLQRQPGRIYYDDRVWVMSLLKTMDSDYLRQNEIMISIYKDISDLVESGRLIWEYQSEKEVYLNYMTKYSYIFERKSISGIIKETERRNSLKNRCTQYY